MLALYTIKNVQELKLGIDSYLQDLPLWDVEVEIECPGSDVIRAFETEPLLPGVILTQNQRYVGMISRQRFFEHMSRPYNLEMFSQRPINSLYNLLRTEILELPGTTPIKNATQLALQRSPNLVYEPVLIVSPTEKHQILDFHQLLLAYSQIHVLTVTQLQQMQKQVVTPDTTWSEFKQNYKRLVENENTESWGQIITSSIAQEINHPVNFLTGNLIHANRHIRQLFKLVNLYQEYYPKPDGAIQDFINQIELNDLTQELPKLLSSLKDSSKHLQYVIRKLRNFTNNQSEKTVLDIHESIDSALLFLQSRLAPDSNNHKISVIKQYGKLPSVMGNVAQLNRVFMNILLNAIDALEEEMKSQRLLDPYIRIQTELLNDQVIIRIIDNGCGMTESTRQRIFEPFFTTKPVGQGTGLGLAVSHQIIVEKHSGQLECVSSSNQGTEFIIKLPISNYTN